MMNHFIRSLTGQKSIRYLLLFCLLAVLQSVQAQTKQSYNIGFIFDTLPENAEILLVQMQNEIRSVVGQDATINFPESGIYINNLSLEGARDNFKAINENPEVDIILAFGVLNNVVILENEVHNKPTILFGTITREFKSESLSEETSGIDNLSLILTSQSITQDLSIFSELVNFRKVGIVFEDYLMDVLPLEETIASITDSIGVEHRIINYNSLDEIIESLDEVDAVYFANTFFLTEDEISRLSQEMIDRRIPSYTSSGSREVELGIMASNQTDDNLDQFFRRIALNVEAIVNGKNPSELPTYLDATEQLILNFNTASLIGGPLKYSLIYDTQIVGEFKNVLSERDYSLIELLSEARERNLGLLVSNLDVELSNQDVRSAVSDMFPNLESSVTTNMVDPELARASSGQNPEFSTTGNLTLSQIVYSQDILTNIYIQRALKDAQVSTNRNDELDVILDAANAYFNALIARSNLEITVQNLEVTRRNLQIAQQNYEAGLTGKSDVLRFQSQMAQDAQTMVETVSLLEFSFSEINRVLNYPLDREIDVLPISLTDDVFTELDLEKLSNFLDDISFRDIFIRFLVQEAILESPELQALNKQLEIADASIRLANTGRFIPDVSLLGQYNHTFSRSGAGSTYPTGFIAPPDGHYTVGLSFSLPIFQQNKQNINLQTAKITRNQIELLIEQTERNIERQVENNALDALNQISNLQLSEISLESAAENLDLIQTSYSNGAVSIIQLIDAQSNLLNAQISNNNALYNFMLSVLRLERSLGYFFFEKTATEREEFKTKMEAFLLGNN
ncbi:MAG: TolC family protein [Balneola sp.]|nr:MAG: TolC family protein [Balneola sp.]